MDAADDLSVFMSPETLGMPRKKPAMTLAEFFSVVYRPLRLRGGSENTTRLHRAAITSFGKHLGREPTLEDLSDLAIAGFLEHRACVDCRSPYTVERERCAIMALARLAVDRRLVATMPVCPPGKLPRRVPRSWTVDEFSRLVAAAREAPGVVGAVPAALFWPALLMVAWETGERISALMAAKASALVLSADGSATLIIDPEMRKGQRDGRAYDLSPATAAAVVDGWPAGRVALFPWPFSRTHLWSRLSTIVKRAGLGGRRVGFHQIRRTAATHVAAAGANPAEFLGHSAGSGDRVATQWYVDPTMLPRKPAWQILPRIGR